MNLSGFIARRYLFAKKSHNVINIISGISAAGIAIGCAALVIILSVYNGFDGIIRTMNNSYTPDMVITPSSGKTFSPNDPRLEILNTEKGIKTSVGILEDNVYLVYGGNQIVATAKGVDSVYQQVSGLQDYIVEGEFRFGSGAIREAVIGRTLAFDLGLRTAFLTPLEVYFPSRSATITPLNPFGSLHSVTVYPAGVVSLDQNFDKKYVFLPIETMRTLLEEPENVSAIELYFDASALNSRGIVPRSTHKCIDTALGSDYIVRDRQEQNSTMYKLLASEKAAIYAILLFVVLIISCNIFGSLSMLVIEKQNDVAILESLGAEKKFTDRIFIKEGWFISLLGVGIGIAVGLLICFIQQKFGIVKMPGNFVVDAYPVIVRWQDVLITAASVSLIGYITARLAR